MHGNETLVRDATSYGTEGIGQYTNVIHMGISYIHAIVLMVIAIFLSWEIRQLYDSGHEPRHKRLGYASYLLVGLFIGTMIFTEADFWWMAAVWVVCAPTWAYTMYLFRELDRKKVIYTYVIVTICTVASWLEIYF